MLLVVWLLGIAAAVVGASLLGKRRKALGGTVLAGGLLVVLAPFGLLGYSLSPLSDGTTIQVEPLDPPNDPWFTVELRHRTFIDDGTQVAFNARKGPGEVAAVFQDQHPDGVVTADDPLPLAQGAESIWHVSGDDIRYELEYSPDGGTYALVSQLVVVNPADSGTRVRIPFPRSAFNATDVDAGQPYANSWTEEQWRAFYADITLADVDGDTITVPTNRGGTAIIRIEDGLAVVTLAG